MNLGKPIIINWRIYIYCVVDDYVIEFEMEEDFVTVGITFGKLKSLNLNIKITFGLPQWVKLISLGYKALTRKSFNLKYITLY